ncbi:MAG: DEAD/DEAH box helicase [Chloroflexi bacterium]|nr:DEAD/DEAH box helicase [Chloroflexota bacterium]
MSNRLTGTVKWYHRKKGFGFIVPDGDYEDVFLHHSALERHHQAHISEGDRVAFGVEERRKGPSALNVELLTNGHHAAAQEDEQPTQPDPPAGGFAALGLNDDLLRAVADAGYTDPTPIQQATIPHGLAGRDVLGGAQTGTGKTAAFALPTLQRLAGSGGKRAVRALIVAPTRELALQIATSFEVYGRYTGLRVAAIYGGVSQRPQVSALRKGVDILVATPGRLIDLMNQGHIKLDRVETLILDEADRMLDMGFLPDIRRIIKAVPNDRQTLLFSATIPRAIRSLAASLLDNPVEVTIAPDQPTVEAIEQSVYFVHKRQKQALLEHLLSNPDFSRVLVFTRTKRGANRVVRDLERGGISAEPIHGNKSQGARQRALRNFRKGKTRVLVATDVAARGIDVDDISHVIQYDLPNEPETYVHRIGRTGRAGAAGIALAFCARDERSYLRDIERLTGERMDAVQGHPFSN